MNNAKQIEILHQTIQNAEKIIRNAKAEIDALSDHSDVIYGKFDGRSMLGDDDRLYPVPGNYASKSKLVTGDGLKLTVSDGKALFKQISPVDRKTAFGVVEGRGALKTVLVDGRSYKILLAVSSYLKLQPGDEVVAVIPRDGDAEYAAIEDVVKPV